MWDFVYISVYRSTNIWFGKDGAFSDSDGGGGISCRRQTTLQQGGLWYMVHKVRMIPPSQDFAKYLR